MYKFLQWTLVTLITITLLYIGYAIYGVATFSFDDGKHYTTLDLIDNYKSKTQQINDLKHYINSITPANKTVDIEFENNRHLYIFHVTDNGNYDNNWDLSINSFKVDTLLQKLNWTHQTLITLKEKLDAANCISVKNGEPCNIGFQRSGMGKYFYNIFDNPIADSVQSDYNDSCTYILYNNKVVLEYGGGAIGSQCFPKK